MTHATTANDQATPSPVPAPRSFISSLVAGLISGIAVIGIVGFGELLSSTNNFYLYILVLLSFYVAPLPFVIAGFTRGLDAALICLLIIVGSSIALFGVQSALLTFGGFTIPMIIMMALHDHRILGVKNNRDNKGFSRESLNVNSVFHWLVQTDKADDRHRMGTVMIAIACYYTLAIAVTEFTLKQLGLETLYDGFIASIVTDQELTPQELQLTQEIVPILELIPAAIILATFVWMLASLKLGLWLIRLKRNNDKPHLKPAAGAIPIWYILMISVIAVITSQAQDDLKFVLGNALIILAIPGFIIGLGLIHHIAGFFRFRWVVILLLYCLVGVTTQFWSLAMVTAIGFLDASLHIREWLSAKLGPKMEKKYA